MLSSLAATGLVGAMGAVAKPGHVMDGKDQPQSWLKVHAAPVVTIDFANEDFTDLEPLADAVGSARVVQLGEPSHGAGSAFAAKARIVKFLYQKHGFDVLIWESGLYDTALAQAAMCSPTLSAVDAARKGVFTLWSEAAEVKPLFEFIKASQATLRPLTIAGFDMQVTADGTRQSFAQYLSAIVNELRPSPLRKQAVSLAEAAVAAQEHLYTTKFSNPHDLDSLTAATLALQAMLESNRAAFQNVRGPQEMSFMGRALKNMQADAVFRTEFAKSPQTTTARESYRDALNAGNLRWLLEQPYAGRKAIVWAHNVHVMNAYYAPGFKEVHLSPHPGDMKTTGCFLKSWLGDTVYSIGITAFEGEEGFAIGGPRNKILSSPPESLEARLHDLHHEFAFLDCRMPANARRNPLRAPLKVRAPKFDINLVADLGRMFDGIFFVDQMKPATHV